MKTEMYRIVFSNDAKKDLKELSKKAPQAVKKLSKLLEEIQEHPRTGTGQVYERETQTIDTESNTDNACRQRGARRVSKSLKPEHLHFTARLAPASQREKNKCVPIWYLF